MAKIKTLRPRSYQKRTSYSWDVDKVEKGVTIFVTKWAFHRKRVRVDGRLVKNAIIRFDNAEIVHYKDDRQIATLPKNFKQYRTTAYFYRTKEEAIAQMNEDRINGINRLDEEITRLMGMEFKVVRSDGGPLGDLADLVEEASK